MSDLILRRSHGQQLDHIGLGVPNTEEGVAEIEALTGAKVDLHPPEPDQWYWSGSLAIGEDSFLEIIGPNPEWRKFQPFRTLLGALDAPQLLFWYLAVSDFKQFEQSAKNAGGKLERVEAVNLNGANTAHSSYIRGYMGPGFLTQRPNIIEWRRKPKRDLEKIPECSLKHFGLSHPKAHEINSVFEKVGLDYRVEDGPNTISLSLETPNGEISFSNKGIALGGVSALFQIARLWLISVGED